MSNVTKPLCSIFWQDRLVPETIINAFPFFPELRTQLQCERNLIPSDWRERVHCFLFFGWDFRHISNNKLKFQVDPNMNEWLNNKKRFINEVQTKPQNIKDGFLRFVLRL